MPELVSYTATVVMGFLAIMNPLANAPVFLGLTADDDPATQKAVARNSLFLAFVIIAAFTLAGHPILEMFGITLYAFRVTGGILVFGIGYTMLHGEPSRVHQPAGSAPEASRDAQLGVAVSPLAVPILAGAGTIATAMSFAASATPAHILITIVSFAVICLVSYAFFVSGGTLIRYIGQSAVNAITKMMGLILAVIGVQMLIDGIHGAIRAFR